MAQKTAGFTNTLESKVKTSNTGHAEDPAIKAPLSAKKSVMIGGEQTSDGRKMEQKIEKSRAKKRNERGHMSEKAIKHQNLNLEELLPKERP